MAETTTPDTGTTTTEFPSGHPLASTGDQPPADTGTPPDTGGDTDWKAEAEKWQGLARKHEERAKANAAAARERDELKRSSMTEQERAVDEARAAARTEVMAEVAETRVDDAVRAAAAGRTVDIEALLEGLDRRKFVGDDAQPDRKAITEWLDRVAPAGRTVTDLGQGARGGRNNTALNGDPLLQSVEQVLGIR